MSRCWPRESTHRPRPGHARRQRYRAAADRGRRRRRCANCSLGNRTRWSAACSAALARASRAGDRRIPRRSVRARLGPIYALRRRLPGRCRRRRARLPRGREFPTVRRLRLRHPVARRCGRACASGTGDRDARRERRPLGRRPAGRGACGLLDAAARIAGSLGRHCRDDRCRACRSRLPDLRRPPGTAAPDSSSHLFGDCPEERMKLHVDPTLCQAYGLCHEEGTGTDPTRRVGLRRRLHAGRAGRSGRRRPRSRRDLPERGAEAEQSSARRLVGGPASGAEVIRVRCSIPRRSRSSAPATTASKWGYCRRGPGAAGRRPPAGPPGQPPWRRRSSGGARRPA